MLTSSFLITVVHPKPIADLGEFIAQRAWTIDGIYPRANETGGGAVTVRNLPAGYEAAFRALLLRYTSLVDSGDCYNGNSATEQVVIAARAALAQ
jgi:hypothetical protein